MSFLEKLPEKLVDAIASKDLGYAILVGFFSSGVITSFALFALDDFKGLNVHPPIADAWIFISVFTSVAAVVAVVSMLLSFRKGEADRHEKELGVRETQVTEREGAIALREETVFKREKGDLLSGFREKIEGAWEMEFEVGTYASDGSVRVSKVQTVAIFQVDQETEKLILRSKWRGDDDFEKEDLKIDALSIWPVLNPLHLDYFYDLKLSNSKGGEIAAGPIFVHLSIEFEDKNPVVLRGRWYDLEGTFAKLRMQHWLDENDDKLGRVPLPTRGRIRFDKLTAETFGNRSSDEA